MTMLAFGPFVLDSRSLELRRDGRRVRLRPQPCRVLALLAARPGELVTREELRLALWPEGVHVRFDVGLNSCIKQIRKALGDSVGAPRYLETLSRRGYRFIGDVQHEDARHAAGHRRLAVLPFRLVDRAAGSIAPLTDGLTEEVVVLLSRLKVPHLSIVARSTLPEAIVEAPSLRALRDAAVDLALEGCVQAAASGIRVSVQLVDTVEMTSLWGQLYDAPAEDLLGAQRALARSIANDLRSVVSLVGLRPKFTGTAAARAGSPEGLRYDRL